MVPKENPNNGQINLISSIELVDLLILLYIPSKQAVIIKSIVVFKRHTTVIANSTLLTSYPPN